MEDLNNTTRKYPRTLEEAFPKDHNNAYTIIRYKPEYGDWAVWIMCVFAAGFLTGVLCMEAWR